MSNISQTPFTRDMKRRPEQHVHKLNELRRHVSNMDTSNWIFSQDKKRLIVIGVQPVPPNPANTFGIRTYTVKGDRIELQDVVI